MTSLIADAQPMPTANGQRDRINASKIRDKYQKGQNDTREVCAKYRVNSAYIDMPNDSSQWVYWHQTSNQIVQLPRDPRRVRATIPRVGPESRRIMAKLLRRPLVFEVPPDAPDTATIRGARTAEAVLAHTAEMQKWNRLREELAWSVWKGGTAFLALDWDTQAGRNLGIDPVTNRPVGTGDIRVSTLSIAEFFTEPGTRDAERSQWWIKAETLPPAEVKRLYKLKEEPQADANATSAPVRPAGGSTAPRSLTLVLTYYERPSSENQKGTVATIVGNSIVDGPHPWPFPFTDRLNIVCARETLIEGQWFGKTVITDAVPVQTALNHSWTSALEHMKQVGNARIQTDIINQSETANWSDEAGEFVYYNGTTPYQYLSPPAMPDWWQRIPERLENSMDDILGVHDISRGQAPTNVQSGLGLSILQEQDDTPTGKLSQTLADAFGDLATLVLQTYEQKVQSPEQRTARITGPRMTERVTWDGSAFLGQTFARVPYDAVAPMNQNARFAQAMQLVDRQIIHDPRSVSMYLDVGGLGSSLIETIDPDVVKARSENQRIMFGEPCVPAVFDNHATHIQEHNAERKSARYERADKQTQETFDLHIQAHSTLAAEEMGQQALKAQYAPPLAGAAQAGQPPGSAMGAPGGALPQSAVMGAITGGAPGAPVSPAEATPNQ